jgi:flagellar protein FlaJ
MADDRFADYRKGHPGFGVRSFLVDPIAASRRRPALAFLGTIPAGIAVAAVALIAGLAEPTNAALEADPLGTTWWLGVAPLLVAVTPVAVVHELERRRALEISERFPDVLSILASANRMGIGVVDAFDLVTRWTSGSLADEMRKTRNDVRWNHDLTGGLQRLADRLHVPQLSRTMSLLAEGSRSSGDLHGVLDVAATQTRNHARLRRARRREIGSYVAIVVLGFLVYLLVILIMEVSYLQPLADLPATEVPDSAGDAPVPLAGGPVEQYRILFVHSTLIQAFGSGLIAGKLAENDALSGLKYGVGLVLFSVGVFALFL